MQEVLLPSLTPAAVPPTAWMAPMRRFDWSAFALVCAASSLGSACGVPPKAAPAGTGASQPEAPENSEGSTQDGGIVGDAADGVSDAAPVDPAPVAQPCALEGDSILRVANTFVSPDDALALSMRNEGAMLSWVGYEGGKRKVRPTWFSRDMVSVSGAAFDNGGSEQLDPTTTATRTGFMTVWSDSKLGSFELFAQATTSQGEPASAESPLRLTRDEDDDRAPVVAQGADDHMLVAWRAERESDQGRTLLIDADGTPQGAAHDILGFGAILGRPALVALKEGYLLAWVDAASRQVRLQRLSDEGAAVGAFVRADSDGNAEGHLDLAVTPAGGALIFDVRIGGERAEIRFRSLDGAGQLLGSERALNQSGERALSPSIAAFRGGYVVAYRGALLADTALHVMFIDAGGERISSIDVAAVHDLDLPIALRAAPDGLELFLAWSDGVPETGAYQLSRTWLHCR